VSEDSAVCFFFRFRMTNPLFSCSSSSSPATGTSLFSSLCFARAFVSGSFSSAFSLSSASLAYCNCRSNSGGSRGPRDELFLAGRFSVSSLTAGALAGGLGITSEAFVVLLVDGSASRPVLPLSPLAFQVVPFVFVSGESVDGFTQSCLHELTLKIGSNYTFYEQLLLI
jgi:hypothetical protein